MRRALLLGFALTAARRGGGSTVDSGGHSFGVSVGESSTISAIHEDAGIGGRRRHRRRRGRILQEEGQEQPQLSNETSSSSSQQPQQEALAANGGGGCSICGHVPGSELRDNFVPSAASREVWLRVATPSSAGAATSSTSGAFGDGPTVGGGDDDAADASSATCADWESYATGGGAESGQTTIPASSGTCLELRDWLTLQCCTDLPALYRCEDAVQDALHIDDSSIYRRGRVPVTTGDALDVAAVLEVTNVEIVNHGVDGGAVQIGGYLMLHWTDERLAWDYSAAGSGAVNVVMNGGNDDVEGSRCASTTSVRLDSDEIWVPGLDVATGGATGEGGRQGRLSSSVPSSDATVLADGRVYWTRPISLTAGCETTLGGAGKVCSVQLEDLGSERDRVRYVAGDIKNGGEGEAISGGIIIHDVLALPEYRLDRSQSTVREESIADGSEEALLGPGTRSVHFTLVFEPLETECNVCGKSGGDALRNGTIHSIPPEWIAKFPGTKGWSCTELDSLLRRSVPVKTDECLLGRASFEEPCCDDPPTMSSYECEQNIHDIILERKVSNTVTPPDASPRENDTNFDTKDAIDVEFSLDVEHVVGVDVTSNSMTMVVSLELQWYDQRLAWEPFTGGCHRASFRASFDAELTEIWVPSIELVNKVSGVQHLPEAMASVRYDGRVGWRRSGVLTAGCDLTGVVNFPFDTTGCFMDFGDVRDPMYHRENYIPTNIEYSGRLTDASWNYQEYKLVYGRSEMTLMTESLSGFRNDLIRVQFYFERATSYYMNMFVVLYILFTYLSFGMFFVDYGIGERLGYGSSVLFVMVAQDITLSESTPVTQEYLWIYRLSLGSKLFVICGIVESIVLLWLYSREDFKGEYTDERSDEETRNFIDDDAPSLSDNLENGGTDRHASPSIVRRSQSFGKKVTGACHTGFFWLGQQILRIRVQANDSKRTKLIKCLRLADMSFFVVFVIVYTVLLGIMFSFVD